MLNIILIIAVLLILAPVVFWLSEGRKSDTEKLFADMRRRGLSDKEQRDECALRIAIVDVQIKASGKVAGGACAFDAVRDAAEAYCSQLARLDRPLARRILQHISALPVEELLLPEAVEIHERRWAGFKAPPLDPHVKAALRLC